MYKDYLALTKPGIIMGNLLAAGSGFFLASGGQVDWLLLVAVLAGTSLIIASGCTFNNIIDSDIDSRMDRTNRRPLVVGSVGKLQAAIFGTITGLLGFLCLYYLTSVTAFYFGVLGFFVYVVLYSLYYKRQSVYGTLVGSISGACPPAIGYIAVTGHCDLGSGIVFALFCIWQIPHSYAIAVYRFDDYHAANIPVLPQVKGIAAARWHIILYIIAFMLTSLLLTIYGYTGYLYAIVMSVLSLYWLYITAVKYDKIPNKEWGKKSFLFSIITITSYSFLVSVDAHIF